MKRGLRKALVFFIILFLLCGSYSYWAINRNVKLVSPEITYSGQPVITKSNVVWPAAGQSAVGIVGTKIIDTHNIQTPAPIASTAKMVTALLVLQNKPLKPGEPGPVITLTQADVNIYNAYSAALGSVVTVQAGEQITEKQMLEAMFLPSANNMADSLAIWAFGSLDSYSKAANAYLASLGITSTKIGSDASGFSPSTTSTAGDLVKIGELLIEDPVLAAVVKTEVATDIPLVPHAKNVNYLLGTNNVIGIKTGNTDQAGGVYVSASKTTINGQEETIVTANMGTSTLGQAVSGSLPLITSSQHNFVHVIAIKKGAVAGGYKEPWDNKFIPAIASNDLSSSVWGGSKSSVAQVVMSQQTYPARAGSIIGSAALINNGSTTQKGIILKQDFNKPSVWWKLLHP